MICEQIYQLNKVLVQQGELFHLISTVQIQSVINKRLKASD